MTSGSKACALVAGAVLCAVAAGSNPDGDSRLPVGSPAPEFQITDLSGKELKLSALRAEGKPVLLEFWATWCPPCRASLPSLQSIYEQYGRDKVVMISIITTDSAESAAKFVKEHPEHGWHIAHNATEEKKSIGYERYTISGFPTFFLIDANGTIVFSEKGQLDPARTDRLKAAIAKQVE